MKVKGLLRKSTSLLLAVALLLGMQSIAFASSTTELSGSSQSGDTTVTGTVAESTTGSPSYVVTIPASIDFGTLTAPDTDEDSYKSVTFDVTASSFVNFSEGTGVAVLVKDSTDEKNSVGDWGAEFYITNENSISLEYSILDPDGDDISADGVDLTYESGLLYYVFGATTVATSSSGSATVTGTVRLNQSQLYGLDLEDEDSDYVGTYEGTLNFYVKVVDLSDYSS